jgi:glycosyltransferase involved in cell wall biosynthesis
MRLAYVTSYNVLDRSTWLKDLVGLWGAGYYLARSLENQGIQLDYMGPLTKEKEYTFTNRLKIKFYKKLFKKVYACWAAPSINRYYADQVSIKLSSSNANIVLCPENAQPVAYLECKQPIVLWTDAPQSALIDSYPGFSNLCNETKRYIYALEKAAFDRAKLLIFSSDWAAQTSIQTYGIEPSKVRVVPWGANIECNRTDEDVKSLVESKTTTPCKLLFIGVDWERKGGDIALQVAKELNEMGLETELLVVGSQPPANEPLPSFVKPLGFVNKETKEGLERINKIFSESHFFILPSKADCSPFVLCEATSFGLPCLATDVGGIPTIIKEDLNGKTFSLDASISEYCSYIASLMTNYNEYKTLARSSFNEYQSRLNWSVAGQTAKKLMMELV